MTVHRLLGLIPASLAVGLAQPTCNADGPAAPEPATLKITRLLPHDPAEQLTRGRRMLVEGETLPEGYRIENSWLVLREPETSGTAPLYRRAFGAGEGSTLSRRPAAPGMAAHEHIGYIHTQPGPGRVELRSVYPAGTPGEGYFVTDFTNCEGSAYREDEFLGYAYRTIPYDVSIHVSPSTIEAGDELEITWRTTRAPEGQAGRVNRFPERIVGMTLSPASVSGAFLDAGGAITGAPPSDPFAKHFPLTGSIRWNTARNVSDEYAQRIPPGEYQIQLALFPACLKLGESPCDWELDDILFTASEVFTVTGPPVDALPADPPANLTAACGANGEATFGWTAPSRRAPVCYAIRIQDTATGEIVHHADNITRTSYRTQLPSGRTYAWWVHAQYADGESPHTIATSPLACP